MEKNIFMKINSNLYINKKRYSEYYIKKKSIFIYKVVDLIKETRSFIFYCGGGAFIEKRYGFCLQTPFV